MTRAERRVRRLRAVLSILRSACLRTVNATLTDVGERETDAAELARVGAVGCGAADRDWTLPESLRLCTDAQRNERLSRLSDLACRTTPATMDAYRKACARMWSEWVRVDVNASPVGV